MSTEEDLSETARQVEALDRRVLSLKADVRSQEQMDAVVAKGLAEFGKIDILIANHGIFNRAAFWEMSETQWNDMIDVNLSGVWKSAKAVAPHMIERHSGSIVIISSTNGVNPSSSYAHYCAAKHGAIGLMKCIALELAPFGVRCNAILPGLVWTPMIDNPDGWDFISGHEHGTREETLENAHHNTALRGVGWMDPEEIAKTAVYLNSALASKVTGTPIPVEAGLFLLTRYNHSPVRD